MCNCSRRGLLFKWSASSSGSSRACWWVDQSSTRVAHTNRWHNIQLLLAHGEEAKRPFQNRHSRIIFCCKCNWGKKHTGFLLGFFSGLTSKSLGLVLLSRLSSWSRLVWEHFNKPRKRRQPWMKFWACDCKERSGQDYFTLQYDVLVNKISSAEREFSLFFFKLREIKMRPSLYKHFKTLNMHKNTAAGVCVCIPCIGSTNQRCKGVKGSQKTSICF